MDVSRIEAFNPNKINWRDMTAKDILEYEKQGIEVPDLYVQWAYEFLNNVTKYDNDEITYEKAQSISRHSNNNNNVDSKDNNTQTQNEKGPDKENPEASETTPEIGSAQDGTEAIQLTAAQTKRKDFQDKGVSLRDQAVSFTQDSSILEADANAQTQILSQVQNNSDNEISQLEGAMKELLAQAEAKQQELKQNVDKINHSKNDSSTFSKIEQLQKELEQYGMDGLNQIAQTNSFLTGHISEIASGFSVMVNTNDFGVETVDIGNELTSETGEAWWLKVDREIGEKAIDGGNSAISQAYEGAGISVSANTTNNANISRANSFKNDIQSITGVKAQNSKQQNDDPKHDPITGKEKESEKSIKTSSNDGTDTTDKLNISLDELVKRKVRRGEYSKEA